MKFQDCAALFSMVLLICLSACSTTSDAETQEPTPTQQQADDHDAHHRDDEQTGADSRTDREQMMEQMCPMQVEGTTRELIELDDAVAMEFTTTGDVDELRRRVERIAQRHDMMHREGHRMHRGPGHRHGEDRPRHRGRMHGEMSEEMRQMHRQMMQMMTDVTVETEEIDGGIRLHFIPDDSEQLDELYQMMQQHTQMMEEQGRCPMMQMMGDDATEEQEEQ